MVMMVCCVISGGSYVSNVTYTTNDKSFTELLARWARSLTPIDLCFGFE